MLQANRFTANPTSGYQQSIFGLGAASAWVMNNEPWFCWGDVPLMMRDPAVKYGLKLLRTPLSRVTCKVTAHKQAVADFVNTTLKQFWERDLPRLVTSYHKWGRCVGGAEYRFNELHKRMELARVRRIEPYDTEPRIYTTGPLRGQFAGYVLRSSGGNFPPGGFVGSPNCFYFCGHEELSAFCDMPRIAGAFTPYLEKNAPGGLRASRRLFNWTKAIGKTIVRYPNQWLTLRDGTKIHGEDLARQMGERLQNGSVIIVPNDEHLAVAGKFAWEIEEPTGQPDSGGIRDTVKDIDQEIWIGLDIPPEIIQASDVGSGWSGRGIPMETWYAGADELAGLLFQSFNDQVLKPLVYLDFRTYEYEVELDSLLEQFRNASKNEGAGEADGGQPPGEAGGQPPAKPGAPYQGPRGGKGVYGPDGKPHYQNAGASLSGIGDLDGDGNTVDDGTQARLEKAAAQVTGIDPKASRMRKIAVIAMLHLREQAILSGNPHQNDELLHTLAELMDDPEELAKAFGSMKSAAVLLSWIAHGQSKSGKPRWKDDQTGELRYQKSQPGTWAAERQRRTASAKRGRDLYHLAFRHQATADDLRELATHIPAMNVSQLRSMRTQMMASFKNARKRDGMVSALIDHVKGRTTDLDAEAKAKAKFTLPPATHSETWPDGTNVDFHPSPFPLVEAGSVALPSGKQVKKAVETSLSLADLHGSQSHVTSTGIAKDADDSGGKPLVIQSNGVKYIQDGHHRLTKQLLNGDKDADVRFVDLDNPETAEKPDKEHAKREKRITALKRELAQFKKTHSVANVVIGEGGIHPETLKGIFNGMKEAVANGVPMRVFRGDTGKLGNSKRAGMGADVMAEILQASGDIQIPDSRSGEDYLLELLTNGAVSLNAPYHDHAALQDELFHLEREHANATHDPAVIEAAIRSGEEQGARAADAGESPHEADDHFDPERDFSNHGDENGELDDSFDFGFTAKPEPAADDPIEPAKPKPIDAGTPKAPKIDAKTGTPFVFIRAAAGGEISPVNGQHYAGGQLMPIHGLSVKSEPTGTGGGAGGPVKANPNAKPPEPRPAPTPMTPEEIAAKAKEAEDLTKWKGIGAGPLGKMLWHGEKPNSKALGNNLPSVTAWREYAEQVGPAGIKHITDTLDPKHAAAIDKWYEEAKAAPGGTSLDESNKAWPREELKKQADYFRSTFRGGIGHERQVPGSHYAMQLVNEMLDNQNSDVADPIDRRHQMNELLKAAHTPPAPVPEEAPAEVAPVEEPSPAKAVDLFGRPLPKSFKSKAADQLTMDDAAKSAWMQRAEEHAAELGKEINQWDAGGRFRSGLEWFQVGSAEDGFPIHPVGADGKAAAAPIEVPAEVEPEAPDVDDEAGVVADDTPRTAAAKRGKVLDSNYEFARASAIGNFGEDLKGSARHTRNQWKGLEDAEANGTAAAMVTRDNLFKAEPHSLMSTITPANALAHLAAHHAMNAFPAAIGDEKTLAAYERLRTKPAGLGPTGGNLQTPEGLRAQYYDAFQTIKAEAEKAALEETDPKAVAERIAKTTSVLIRKYRGTPAGSTFGSTDPYNPVANALVKLGNNAGKRYSANSINGKMTEFGKRLSEKYGEPSPAMLEAAHQHVQDIIEGDSLNKTFGTKAAGGGPAKFNPSSAYVTHATRIGGRPVEAKDLDNGKAHMLETLKLRGLQWGNSVTDDERKHHLNKTAEAFADLADVTGLPDSAISLGGRLGLAIGARGKGSASAHYEPDSQVINLTRKSGVGSLAHEWGHALDHSLNDFDTNGILKSQSAIGANPSEVRNAFSAIRQAANASGYEKRLRSVVREMDQAGTLWKDANYWLSPQEMFARTFERHVQAKLHDDGRENTYLTGLHKETHPLWPNAEEQKAMAPAMEALLSEIRKAYPK